MVIETRGQRQRRRMRVSQRALRSQESSSERNRRRANDRARHRLTRASQNEEERSHQQRLNRNRMSIRRVNENTPTYLERLRRSRSQTQQRRPTSSQPGVAIIGSPLRNIVQRLDFQPRTINQVNRHRRQRRDIALLPPNRVHRHDCGNMDVVCSSCGALLFVGERVSGSSKQNPRFQLCCKEGKILLPTIDRPPEPYMDLLLSQDPNGKHFRNFIRTYNNAFAFTSSGANFDRNLASGRQGVFTWRVNGNFKHMISTNLLPTRDQSPKFAQIYIYDTSEQIQHRLDFNSSLSTSIIQLLTNILQPINHYIQHCIPHIEELQTSSTQTFDLTIQPLQVQNRRYDLPTATEVAAIIPYDSIEHAQQHRQIRLHKRILNEDGLSQPTFAYISQMDCNYDPLHYVLLFLRGEPGWHPNLLHYRGTKTVTQLQYYSYRLMVRTNDFPHFHLSGRLAQEYVVDCFCKIEEARLDWCRRNQQQLRAETYQGLMDEIVNNHNPSATGRLIVLPPTFVGGDRFMKKLYLDSMAIVRKYGKPDLFITFTCNPRWPEVQRALFDNQRPPDRPDITARVFRLKLKAFLNDILKKQVFGKINGCIYTIEFQKRGLPHCHMLLILDQSTKPVTTDDFDNFVCAELPNPNNDLNLYETITTTCLHGPCGSDYPLAPCMKTNSDGTRYCSKQYPKPFCDNTYLREGSYPCYRRRDNGRFFRRSSNSFRFDNQWVVPYNPYLSKKYNAHINVEIVSTVKAVKYLYKYVYKGGDRIVADLQFDVGPDNQERITRDEIKNHIDARYVSASEAYWRIFSFPMHSELPSVIGLAVHEEQAQQIYTRDNISPDDAIAAAHAQSKTTLTEFMTLNQTDSFARQILYQDVPEHYTWSPGKVWRRRRTKTFAIGRMFFVSPRQRERYYLRMLLLHRKGFTSFECIRTVNGSVCPTYQEACLQLNLIRNNEEYDVVMEEVGSNVVSTSAIIDFFALLLVHCEIPDCYQFFEKHKHHMIDDHQNVHNDSDLLRLLDQSLQCNGTSLLEFPALPQLHSDHSNDIVQNSTALDAHDTLEMRVESLNSTQRSIYEQVLSSTNGVFFLDGPGGSGKTYLLTTIIEKFKSLGKKVIVVASSGIALLCLPHGSTAHSAFKIPLNATSTSTCSISLRCRIASEIKKSDLIIWDEAPMHSRFVYECVDRSLRDIRKNVDPNLGNLDFGGIVTVLAGDFRQILPVVKRATSAQVISISLQNSYLWRRVIRLSLTHNMPLSTHCERDWSNFLLSVGDGTYLEDDDGFISLPPTTVLVRDIQDMIFEVFGEDINPALFMSRAILAPKNEHVDTVNDIIIDKMRGEVTVYKSIDTLAEGSGELIPTEYLNSLTIGGMPPHLLRIKKNCVVICLRNIDKKNGILNGTRLRVVGMHRFVLQCKILTEGTYKGKVVYIPRIKLTPSDQDLPFVFTRLQFPVRLAFAMTANKSQCQSFDKIGLYLPTPFFTHGQLYVALSRVRGGSSSIVVLDRSVKNIVYREIFSINES